MVAVEVVGLLSGDLHISTDFIDQLGWISYCGKQVDTIDYCVEHIRELNERIKELGLKLPEEKPSRSCFIRCNWCTC
jgi:hypothetical protein